MRSELTNGPFHRYFSMDRDVRPCSHCTTLRAATDIRRTIQIRLERQDSEDCRQDFFIFSSRRQTRRFLNLQCRTSAESGECCRGIMAFAATPDARPNSVSRRLRTLSVLCTQYLRPK